MITKLLLSNSKLSKTLALMVGVFGFNVAQAQYCAPSGLDCEDGDVILNVTFAGINNDSLCGTDGFSDFTTTVAPAEVVTDQSYNLSVTVGDGWSSETVAYWIDFDNSLTFDADEFFLLGTGSNGVVSGNVVIPADLTTGVYTMRINVVADGLPIDDPCWDDFDYGEFEDYLINVTSSLSVTDFELSQNVTVTKLGENLNISANSTIDQVEVYDITGKVIATQKNLNSQTVSLPISAVNQMLLVKVQSLEGQSTIKKIVF